MTLGRSILRPLAGAFVAVGAVLAGAPPATAQLAADCTVPLTCPAASIGDVTVAEGDSGTTPATFTISLPTPATGGETVDWATGDAGATTADGDYAVARGTVTFAPGESTQTVTVPVNGDSKFEDDEGFSVTLSNPQGIEVMDGEGAGTITNDDSQPVVSVADAPAIDEGNSGPAYAQFAITLSQVSGKPVTVGFATSEGSATTDSDYAFRSGTLTFAPGESAKSLQVTVAGDTAVEPDEDFFLDLSSPAGATPGNARGRAVIRNDDAPPAQEPAVSAAVAASPPVVAAPVLDRLAPRVSSLSLSNTRFAVGKAPTAVAARAKVGTAFRYALTEPATVAIIIDSAKPGQRVRAKCVAPKKTRRARRCTRYAFVGSLTRRSSAGLNVVRFSGRIGRKALKPGNYRARLIATDAANNHSRISAKAFTVVEK